MIYSLISILISYIGVESTLDNQSWTNVETSIALSHWASHNVKNSSTIRTVNITHPPINIKYYTTKIEKCTHVFINNFVKKLVLICALAGCSNAETLNIISPNDGVVYTAAQSLGLDERKNRQELKRFLGVDPVQYEWCAAFVNSVLRVNGIPGSDSVSDYPLTARSFMNWGEPVVIPERGDIVVFPRGNQGWQGHVGFYMKSVYVDNKEYYMILGGNQDNQVSFELYPANKAIAIRRQAGYWSEY